MYVIPGYSSDNWVNFFDKKCAVIFKKWVDPVRNDNFRNSGRCYTVPQILPNVYDQKQPINSETNLWILRFGGMQLPLFLFILSFNTFIITIKQVSLLFLHCLFSQRENLSRDLNPGPGQRTTTEPRCTLCMNIEWMKCCCRQPDSGGRAAHRTLQHRGRGGAHRHQDIRRHHELPGERIRGHAEGTYTIH